MRADAERSSGEKILRVGVESNVWMCPEITGAIQAYNADHGCRRMEIRIATAPVLAALLDLGEIDAAITQSYPEPSRPYDEEELRKGEFLILAAKNHPLILKNAPIEEFIEYEFLIGLDGNGFSPLEARVLFVSRFRRALGAPPRVKVLRNTATALSEV